MDYNNKEATKRILEYAKYEGISDADLGFEINISRQNVQKLRKQQANVPEAKVIQFLNFHRDIDTDWLLFGEGEMHSRPGAYKSSFDCEGNSHFEAVLASGSLVEEENKRLKDIIAEKEKQIETLKETINNLNEHLGKLIAKIK